jgi:hypothetical protein
MKCPEKLLFSSVKRDRQTDDIMMTIPFGKFCPGVKIKINQFTVCDLRGAAWEKPHLCVIYHSVTSEGGSHPVACRLLSVYFL